MNEIQKVEFDLFKCFVDICEKLDLQYFMIEGSAIGTARHGGFIPWDDDLDVGMYREDYNKFMESAPAMLPEGIFLQNYKTEADYPLTFSKLKNSNTTYIEKHLQHYNINHGIYMDIFALDGYPTNRLQQIILECRKKDYIIKCNCDVNMKRTLKGAAYSWILRRLGYDKRILKTKAEFESYLSKFPVKNSSVICNHGSPYGKRDYISASYYGSGTEAVFEGMKVRIPADVDGYLTSLYGDWRTPPAPDKRTGPHPYVICDVEKPYTYYVKQGKNE